MPVLTSTQLNQIKQHAKRGERLSIFLEELLYSAIPHTAVEVENAPFKQLLSIFDAKHDDHMTENFLNVCAQIYLPALLAYMDAGHHWRVSQLLMEVCFIDRELDSGGTMVGSDIFRRLLDITSQQYLDHYYFNTYEEMAQVLAQMPHEQIRRAFVQQSSFRDGERTVLRFARLIENRNERPSRLASGMFYFHPHQQRLESAVSSRGNIQGIKRVGLGMIADADL